MFEQTLFGLRETIHAESKRGAALGEMQGGNYCLLMTISHFISFFETKYSSLDIA